MKKVLCSPHSQVCKPLSVDLRVQRGCCSRLLSIPLFVLARLELNQEHAVCSGSALVLLGRAYSAWLPLLSLASSS